MKNFVLGAFLLVAGQGERVKIGLRSRNGFKFDDEVVEHLANKDVQNMFDWPVWNIYTFEDVKRSGMIVILNDMGND